MSWLSARWTAGRKRRWLREALYWIVGTGLNYLLVWRHAADLSWPWFGLVALIDVVLMVCVMGAFDQVSKIAFPDSPEQRIAAADLRHRARLANREITQLTRRLYLETLEAAEPEIRAICRKHGVGVNVLNEGRQILRIEVEE